MGLIDKISEYYHKADDFILEKHIRIADWVGCNFGKTNYETSSYAAFMPAASFAAASAYTFAYLQYSVFAAGAFLLSLGALAYQNRVQILNEELQRREEFSLDSMVVDPYVSQKKANSRRDRVTSCLFGGYSILNGSVSGIDPLLNVFFSSSFSSPQALTISGA